MNAPETNAPVISPVTNAADLLDGICFEAAYALSGQVFVLADQAQLDALYAQIDRSGMCRHRMPRKTFEFGTQTIIGTWTYAPRGCSAGHDLVQLWRDDEARSITLQYRFSVSGDCPYELVRPLWIAIGNSAGYTLTLDVTG